MKSAHAGMGVSEAYFNALVEDLVKSLDKFNVPARWTGLLEKRQGKWLLIQSHFSVV